MSTGTPILVSVKPVHVRRPDGRVTRGQAGDPVAVWARAEADTAELYRNREDARRRRNPVRATFGLGWRAKAELDPVGEMGARP